MTDIFMIRLIILKYICFNIIKTFKHPNKTQQKKPPTLKNNASGPSKNKLLYMKQSTINRLLLYNQ